MRFYEINTGQHFVTFFNNKEGGRAEAVVWVKTGDNFSKKIDFNAVSVFTGDIRVFDDDDVVFPVRYELIYPYKPKGDSLY